MDDYQKIAYVFVGPKTATLKKQKDALLEMGVSEIDFWVDTKKSRPERRDMIDLALPQWSRRIVCIYAPSIIGSGKKDTAETVMKIWSRGVPIQVVGDEPTLSDKQEDAEDFAEQALHASRVTNARINVETGRVGRKEKWTMDEHTEGLLRILWHDVRVPMARVLDVVHHVGGKGITRENLYSRLGPREKKD